VILPQLNHRAKSQLRDPAPSSEAVHAVSWPGRLRQIHSFFRNRSPDLMLATAAPWTSPLAATGLRAELLECCFSPGGYPGGLTRGSYSCVRATRMKLSVPRLSER
jgi:hypothetical protein